MVEKWKWITHRENQWSIFHRIICQRTCERRHALQGVAWWFQAQNRSRPYQSWSRPCWIWLGFCCTHTQHSRENTHSRLQKWRWSKVEEALAPVASHTYWLSNWVILSQLFCSAGSVSRRACGPWECPCSIGYYIYIYMDILSHAFTLPGVYGNPIHELVFHLCRFHCHLSVDHISAYICI